MSKVVFLNFDGKNARVSAELHSLAELVAILRSRNPENVELMGISDDRIIFNTVGVFMVFWGFFRFCKFG